MGSKRYIQIPRGYISYSQLALWKANKKKYADMYFDQRDELRTTNAGMEYGKVVADALEHGIQTGDLLTDASMQLLPKYDVADQDFIAELKTKDGWVKMLAKPDSFSSITKDFLEYKTAKTMWTQKQAQNHLQMHFYATCIYLRWKIIPSAKLICIETEWLEGEGGERVVVPTGKVEEFPVTFTTKDILSTMALVSNAAKEIELAWASHITNPEIANF